FLHEAVLWHQLNHPNILPLLGVSFDAFPNRVCFVSPLMKNGDIMSYVKRESSNVDTRLTLLFGVAKGIQYLHEMEICHGDIKGINILIDSTRQPRIADLGISSIVVSQSETLQFANATSHGFRGSLRWAPPEVILPRRFQKAHNSSTRDIYAFGCTMLEVLTGEFPFSEEQQDPAILFLIIEGERPKQPASHIIPLPVWDLIERCWDHDPDARATIVDIIETFHLLMDIRPATERIDPGL
ncbi:kinase-like domain-containing protein, partial [Flagelloscypha sp. PMI_526]